MTFFLGVTYKMILKLSPSYTPSSPGPKPFDSFDRLKAPPAQGYSYP